MEQGKAAINTGSILPLFTTSLLLSFLLAGCGSNPPAPMQDLARADGGKKPAALASASRPGRGAYYLDDGPADSIPPGLENTPDAEPKLEPLLPRANRSYVVFGKSYTPIPENEPYKKRGIGSWYGRRYHGQNTSSGEPYDMFAMTAAHPTLPIPSYARVTHIASGRQVIVRINDRGPFLSERIIDLSYTAALKLGYLSHGSGELEVERLMPDEIARLAAARRAAVPVEPLQASALSTPASEALAQRWYLQLGAYAQQANAEQAKQQLGGKWPALEVVQSNGMYRLYAGPWGDRAQAEAARGPGAAMVVQR